MVLREAALLSQKVLHREITCFQNGWVPLDLPQDARARYLYLDGGLHSSGGFMSRSQRQTSVVSSV